MDAVAVSWILNGILVGCAVYSCFLIWRLNRLKTSVQKCLDNNEAAVQVAVLARQVYLKGRHDLKHHLMVSLQEFDRTHLRVLKDE